MGSIQICLEGCLSRNAGHTHYVVRNSGVGFLPKSSLDLSIRDAASSTSGEFESDCLVENTRM